MLVSNRQTNHHHPANGRVHLYRLEKRPESSKKGGSWSSGLFLKKGLQMIEFSITFSLTVCF